MTPIRPFGVRGGRSGATLTEVLMAILIMSIGVVSVITLFPLSILRAVRASQTTNAKVLEENVRGAVRANPWILNGTPVRDSGIASARVVDPFGAVYLGTATMGATIPRVNPVPNSWSLENKEAMLSSVFSLPDSFVPIIDDVPSNVTTTMANSQIEFLGTDVGGSLTTGNGARVTVLSLDGRKSRVYPSFNSTVSVSGSTCTLTPALPAFMDTAAEIGRVVVEIPERRYSWFITCSARSPVNNIKSNESDVRCAIVFRRSLDPLDEQDFTGTLTKGNSSITGLTWSSATTPVLRPGGWIFDSTNGFWYEIAEVTVTSATTADVQLVEVARADASNFMIPTGLVRVFKLEIPRETR